MPIGKGTSLIGIADTDGVIMAADDLVYSLDRGTAVPMFTNVPKVFAGGNVLIGTSSIVYAPQIKYKCDDWVMAFIETHCRTAENDPSAIAEILYNEARTTFEHLESVAREKRRGVYDEPGDRLVNYVITGYPKDSSDYFCFEIGIEVNKEGTGFRYLQPIRHQDKFPHLIRFGEDSFLERAMDGLDPEVVIAMKAEAVAARSIVEVMPQLPESLQRLACYAIGLIKTESYFNKHKVGRNVTLVAISENTRRNFVGTF